MGMLGRLAAIEARLDALEKKMGLKAEPKKKAPAKKKAEKKST